MDFGVEAAGIREHVKSHRAHSPYPEAMVTRALAYLAARRRTGVSVETVAEELSLPMDGLYRWQRERRVDALALRPVVVATASPVAASPLVVHGPCGVRIEGLGLDGVTRLLKALG